MTFGSEIVESFYDYDTHVIGPYTVPIDIHYSVESCQGNAFSLYKFYEIMAKDEDVLAVFNVNNYCFCLLYKDAVRMRPYANDDLRYNKQPLPNFSITPELSIPTYRHVGWVKTYQSCKAIYTWPWKLIQDVNTGEVWSFKDKISGEPLVNPPLSLYKELINTDYRGVYFDTIQNKPVFIN